MGENSGHPASHVKKLTAIGLLSAAVATAFVSLGSGTASAEVTEKAPRPNVTSRQAQVIDQNSLRSTAIGQARGVFDTRSAKKSTVNAQGDVRDSVKAVPGTTAAPFGVRQNGEFRSGAPIGSW